MLATLKPYTTFLVCCAVAAALGVSFGTEYNWLVAGCCLVILVAGLPHGAFDLYILADLFKGRSFFWAIVGYLALIILTVLLWWLAPQLFLIGFLSYSAFHFGDSDWPADSVVNRLGWGSAIVTLPCLLAPDQVTALFTIVLNTPSMPLITDVLGFIAILATLSSCIEFASRKNQYLHTHPFVVLLNRVFFCRRYCGIHLLLRFFTWAPPPSALALKITQQRQFANIFG